MTAFLLVGSVVELRISEQGQIVGHGWSESETCDVPGRQGEPVPHAFSSATGKTTALPTLRGDKPSSPRSASSEYDPPHSSVNDRRQIVGSSTSDDR